MIPQASADYYRDQRRITTTVLLAARKIWGTRPPKDFDTWFLAHIGELFELVTAGQARAVESADSYVSDVLHELGTPVEPDVALSTAPLIGVTSDGRPLDSLIYGAVIHVKGQIASADTVTDQVISSAWESGLNSLMLRMQVQVADAARASTAMSIASRRDVGYTRMLNPPSCSRCAVLAGRFYRWNRGFRRHPGCDCRHIPTREDTSGDLRTDPKEYFDSLTKADQDKIFTRAGAEAIRAGADISQVVNVRRGMSTAQTNIGGWIPKGQLEPRTVYGQQVFTSDEGVTRRGLAYKAMSRAGYAQRQTDIRNGKYFQARAPRLMPETIFEIADDRDDALRLLKLYGYLADKSPRPPGRSSKVNPGQPGARAPKSAGGGSSPPPSAGKDVLVPGDDDGETLARLLDDDFAEWARGITEEQRKAIAQWQRADDRFYQRMQKVLRDGVDDPEAADVLEQVFETIESGVLLREVVTWRGIRNTNGLFGVANNRLDELVGTEVPAPGMLAVTTSRSLAVREFTDPSFGGGPALLRMSIGSGTPAAWVKLVGDPDMAYQRELLLADGQRMRVREVSYTGDLPIVDVEVI
ncbi:hypothetical protein P3H15_27270 [Rhodococcus sp. T2V]|uniref:VG15 protein n=1 Tax=Rhodococcus sp. T2V TaxID=3034164 RepID=UPI0023E286A5|nr:hypothetical protein [Rhodococcus sp. T2V]MDF3308723.1 hypothetical protein [Rhodococcus sp. T2V]